MFEVAYILDNSLKRGIFVDRLYLYNKMAHPLADDFYRIGSVAALTGIAVERLRAWERRHDFSPAHKRIMVPNVKLSRRRGVPEVPAALCDRL